MKDTRKTKSQLIDELQELRQRNSGIENKDSDAFQTDKELRESERQLSTLMNNLPGIAYRCRNDSNWTMQFISSGCQELTGYPAVELIGNTGVAYNDLIHPEDRAAIWDTVQVALAEKRPFELEYRIATADGKQKHVWEKGIGIFAGTELKFLEGFITDITQRTVAEKALKHSEHQYHALFENSPVPLWEEDFSQVKKYIDQLKKQGVKDFRKYFNENKAKVAELAATVKILEINKAVLDICEAKSKDELLAGLPIVFNKDSLARFEEELIAIAEGRSNCVVESVIKTVNGKEKYIHMNWTVVPGYEESMAKIYISTIDISERKSAEDGLRKASRAYKMLSDCNQMLIRATDETQLLHDICQIIVEVGGYRLAWVGYAIQDTEKTVQPVAQMGYDEGYLETVRISWANNKYGNGPTGRAIRTGNAQVLKNTDTNTDYAPWRADALKRGYASSIALPLIAESTTLGSLNIYAQETDAFDADEVELLEELTSDLVFGIKNLRSLAKRKQAEDELRKSEERYRGVVEDTPVLIGRFLPGGEITFVNDAYCKYFGKTAAELIGTNFLQLIPVEDRKRVLANIHSLTADSAIHTHSHRVVSPNGEIRWQRWTNRALFDHQNKVIDYQAIGEDITEQHQAEEALRQSEQKWRSLTEHSPDHIMLLDLEGKIRFINNPVPDLIIEQIIGKSNLEFVPPECRQVAVDCFQRVLKNEQPDHYETKYISSEGATQFFDVRIAPLKDDNEKITGFISTSNDVTERKQVEEALRESKAFNETLLNTSPDIIYIYDLVWRKNIYSNKGILNLLGYSRAEIRAMGDNILSRLMHPADFDYYLEKTFPRYQNAGDGELIEHEYRVKHKDGTWRWLHSKESIFMRQQDGTPQRIFGISGDVTQRKHVEQALEASEHLLQESQKVANLGSYELDIPGGIWKSSPILNNIYGIDSNYKKDFKNWLRIVHPDDRDEMQNYFTKNVLTNFESFNKEYRIKKIDDNTERWVLGLGKLQFDDAGHPIKMIGTVQDITERKQSEIALRESENKYRILFEQSADAILIIEGGKFINCNPATVEMLNYPNKNEFLETHPSQLSPAKQPDGRDSFEKANEMMEIAFDKGSHRFEWDHKKKDGEVFPVEVLLTAIPFNGGKFLHVVWRDITERKIVEKAQHESEEKYRVLVENVNQVLLVAQDGVIKYVNKRIVDLFGYKLESLLGRPFVEFIHPEDKEEIADRHKRRLAGEKIATVYSFRIIDKAGKTKWVEINIVPIEWEGEAATLNFLTDITERKFAEEEIIKLAKFPSDNPNPILRIDVDAILLYANEAALKVFTKPKLRVGKTVPSALRKLLNEVKNQSTATLDFVYKDRIFTVTSTFIPEFNYFNIYTTDITKRKYAEVELKKLGFAVKQSPTVVMVTDRKGNIEYVNPKFTELTGYSAEEVIGKNPRILQGGEVAKETYEYLWKTIRSGKVWRGEFHNKKKNGEMYWENAQISAITNDKGKITNFIGVKEDITRQKQIEDENYKLEIQLRRSQKMETIGTLAGGIAHDFNNLLTPILGYSEMALLSLANDDRLRGDVESILRAAMKAKDLVQQILTFSRQVEQERKPISLQLIVKESLQLLRPSLPATIEIRQNIDKNCGKVKADPTQMHQVVMNLCTNAFHAMENTGGTMTLELKEVQFDAGMRKLHPNLKGQNYVNLRVTDTGVGMDPVTVERIFEPFFSTKQVGKGTGLGLSVVHGIVRSHQGDITVYSEKNKGTAFNIYLPLMQGKDKKYGKIAKSVQSGNERILLVDDEKMIVQMFKQMLQQYGYTVYDYSSSVAALEAFREMPEKVDLLISDLTMPTMTGLDLAREIKTLRTDLPIILITGYSESVSDDITERYGIKTVLTKPIIMAEITDAIRKIFD
ncbi:MAG: PAS domain S-box protein [Calditrichaeota bacterium]|nr:MAG: PAS domain S-box protein [Calditrichota bacterium]